MFAHTTSGVNRGNTWKRERTVRGEEWGARERRKKQTEKRRDRGEMREAATFWREGYQCDVARAAITMLPKKQLKCALIHGVRLLVPVCVFVLAFVSA